MIKESDEARWDVSVCLSVYQTFVVAKLLLIAVGGAELLMGLNSDFPANNRIHYCYRPFYGALCSVTVIRYVSNSRYCLTGFVRIMP